MRAAACLRRSQHAAKSKAALPCERTGTSLVMRLCAAGGMVRGCATLPAKTNRHKHK